MLSFIFRIAADSFWSWNWSVGCVGWIIRYRRDIDITHWQSGLFTIFNRDENSHRADGNRNREREINRLEYFFFFCKLSFVFFCVFWFLFVLLYFCLSYNLTKKLVNKNIGIKKIIKVGISKKKLWTQNQHWIINDRKNTYFMVMNIID